MHWNPVQRPGRRAARRLAERTKRIPADKCSVLPKTGVSLSLTEETLSKLMRVQDVMLAAPASEQKDVQTEHLLHGGMYVRTIRLEADTVLMGALIKIPTTLIVSGRTKVFTGEEWIELNGYHVIEANAGRKQIFVTIDPTVITMMFRTDAQSVEQAEEEFTTEYENLMSRRPGSN